MALTPDEIKAIAKEQAKAAKESALTDEQRLAIAEENFKKRVQELETMKTMKDMGNEVLGIQEKELANNLELLRLEEQRLENRKDATNEEKEALLLRKQGLEAEARGIKQASSLMERYLGLNEKSGDMFRNTGDQVKAMATKMKSLANPANLAGSAVSKVVEASVKLANAQDEAAVSFNKATGASGAYNDNIAQLENEMFNLGVSSMEASQATQDLFMNVSDFTTMSKSTQMELGKTVALLSELGVASSTTTKNIQFLTKVLGQTEKQAAAQTRELFSFATELGVSAEKIAEDFGKAGPLIAAIGENGVEAFKELEAQAKASGMEMDTLLKLVGKFDTFSTAAESVGKLNAIMGGPYLNTLEMVAETDPAERMRMLSEGVRASGVSFDEMSYYQRKAMTAAAGLNNEMELALLLSGDLENAKGPVKTTAEYKKLAAEQKEYNTVMEELGQLQRSFAIGMAPLLPALKVMVDLLTHAMPALLTIGGVAMMFTGAGIVPGLAMATTGVMGVAQQVGDMTYDPKGGPVVQTSPIEGGLGKTFQGTKNDKVVMSPTAGESAAPPVVNVTVKIGDQELKQLVQDVEVSPYSGGKKSKLYDSMMTSMSKEIMKT
jgi:hypothetical protein